MKLETLNVHIRRLARVRESNAPFVSFFYCFGTGMSPREAVARGLVGFEGRTLPAESESVFKQTVKRILEYLDQLPQPLPRSVAMYARGGKTPFFLGIPLQVPLPTRLVVGTRPDLKQLIEAGERYGRYIVLALNHKRAHILEVDLGIVVRKVQIPRTKLPRPALYQWPHGSSDQLLAEATDEWFQRCITGLRTMINDSHCEYLMLAGNSHLAWQFRHSLPHHLSSRFLELVDTSQVRNLKDAVILTTEACARAREENSRKSLGAPGGIARRRTPSQPEPLEEPHPTELTEEGNMVN